MPFRLLLTLALVLLVPTAAFAASRTRVEHVSPLTASGELRSGLRISDRASGSCAPGSEAVPGTYRCFGDDDLIRDPCWQTGARSAICLVRPWAHTVSRLRVRGGFDQPIGGGSSVPWGVRLRSGERCLLLQGASSVVKGKRVNYSCSRTRFLLGRPDRRHSAWRIQRARLKASRFVAGGHAVVRTAYFGRAS
jgi:hypothetical protein